MDGTPTVVKTESASVARVPISREVILSPIGGSCAVHNRQKVLVCHGKLESADVKPFPLWSRYAFVIRGNRGGR
jgi:hypothetical protein